MEVISASRFSRRLCRHSVDCNLPEYSFHPSLPSCASETSREANVHKPLTLTPTLSRREREPSPFSPGEKGEGSLALRERVGVRVSGLCTLASRLVSDAQLGNEG